MRLLLDTNVFLWLQMLPERLGRQAQLVRDQDNELFVSAVSAVELSIKHATNRLALPDEPHVFMPAAMELIGARPLPIEFAHAYGAGQLPPIHRDPFDRILVAQAIQMDLTLLTADRIIAQYPAPTILI